PLRAHVRTRANSRRARAGRRGRQYRQDRAGDGTPALRGGTALHRSHHRGTARGLRHSRRPARHLSQDPLEEAAGVRVVSSGTDNRSARARPPVIILFIVIAIVLVAIMDWGYSANGILGLLFALPIAMTATLDRQR